MLSSFFSGISGLMANSSSINVVGNNIANVNTVGFKGSRASFEDVLYQSINGTSGTSQVGRGTALSSVDTSFGQGSFESTTESTDLAIGGKGFFIVRNAENETNYYTRAGQFRFDSDGYMTNPAGEILQGREIDRITNAPFGVDTDIIISQAPSEPRATELIGMNVNLQSDSPVAGTLGNLSGVANGSVNSVTLSDGKYPRAGTYTLTYNAATGVTITAALVNPDGSAAGAATYGPVAVAAGTTYTNLGGSGLDITTDAALTDGASRTITFSGFSSDYVSATVNPSTTSNYSSSITAYDSLGQPHVVTVYFRKAYETTTPQTSVWEWMAHLDAADSATGVNDLAGWGTLTFNNNGALTTGGGATSVSFDFSQGANPAQAIDLVFGSGSGGGTTTQYPIASTTNFQTQDGYPPGVLQNVTVSGEGVISGHYSNGQILNLYQITLANFNNPNGLRKEGSNLYSETIESGVAYTNAPGEGGLGKISANSLEQSNVDLATEFVKMIIAQRGYQANARVITTTDEVLAELMNIKR
ncbi:MAG TPA: flagellar hook protein FlgE [Syntrophorhabdaceae bacterium]|nr:flagellar hook protein FlgE [Syntrophorhabdaceae bacterium]